MEGKTGTIKWGDNTSSRVVVKEIESYSWLPSDYWLEYQEEETHRPVIHPDYGVSKIIKAPIILPSDLFFRLFTPDVTEEDKATFSYRLNQYVKENFGESEQMEAMGIFKSLKALKGEEFIIKNYLEK
jgi:hypothetical protein